MAKALRWRSTGFAPVDVRAVLATLRGESVLVLGLVAVGLISHGLNMFQYPSFNGIDDEGIYASQAWAILREGQLSPYTYVYDHVPGGWILLAAWMALTGGPHAFGTAIDSGRVLMLLLHVATLVMVCRVARKLGCGIPAAVVGSVLFTLSPLAIGYQRRLLLDNIMLFWCLASLDLLLDGWGRLSRVTLSGICFGIALLTKETAIFLIPPMLYIAWQQRWQHQARFAVIGWLLPMLIAVSFYPLFAALKGELLPAGTTAQFSTSGYGNTGVSLIDALLWQIARDGGGPFNFDNQFWTLLRSDWLIKDPILLIAGVAATILNCVRGLRLRGGGDRRAVATALLGLLPLLYLVRGGIVFDFYMLFALPFLCLNLAVLFAPLLARLNARVSAVVVLTACCAVLGTYVESGGLQPLYRQAPGIAGRDALAWITSHLPADAYILVRDDLWTDLRESGFANVHSYTKVAGDPAIRGGVFHQDWHGVDYLVVSPGLEQNLRDSDNSVALGALQHSHMVLAWTSNDINLELWKVDKAGATDSALLRGSSAFLEHRFGSSGAFRTADGAVTSESQAYALLRAVWSDNRDDFARVWDWTSGHMLKTNGLLAWKSNGDIVEFTSATDADTDAALALLMAGRRWNEPTWLADGTRMVDAIWTNEVALAGDAPVVTAGDWAPGADVLTFNPSYFAPYAYHIFQEVDRNHDWLSLVDSGYRLLFDSSAADLGGDQSAGLAPDWIGIDQRSGGITPLPWDSTQTTVYGYEAPRAYWRVALDLRWDGDGRAAAYLDQAGFLRDEVNRSGTVRAVYAHDGRVASTDTSLVGSAGALAALLTLDPNIANRLYASQLVGAAQMAAAREDVHWGDPSDLYAQEWGWFATALYDGTLTDFWHGGT